MKKSISIVSISLTALLSLALWSCGNGKTNKQEAESSEHGLSGMEHSTEHNMPEGSTIEMNQNQSVTILIDHYLSIKNALVQDDSKGASTAAQKLADSVSAFDLNAAEGSMHAKIIEILKVIKDHGEHIVNSEIDHQREYFEKMTKDFTDLLDMTGTDRPLYQQYCPMYNNNQGGYWLSDSKEIKNPLFGAKMLTCGKVTKKL